MAGNKLTPPDLSLTGKPEANPFLRHRNETRPNPSSAPQNATKPKPKPKKQPDPKAKPKSSKPKTVQTQPKPTTNSEAASKPEHGSFKNFTATVQLTNTAEEFIENVVTQTGISVTKAEQRFSALIVKEAAPYLTGEKRITAIEQSRNTGRKIAIRYSIKEYHLNELQKNYGMGLLTATDILKPVFTKIIADNYPDEELSSED